MSTREELLSVSDPTDFPPENDAPGLRRIDDSLRCRICGEILDTPMTLQCGHSFCSVCVRRSLRDRKECPQCRKPAEELHLIKIAQLEELGYSWRVAREFILNQTAEISRLKKKLEESKRIPERPRKRRKLSKDGPSNSVSSGSEELVRKEGSLHLSASRDSSVGGHQSRSPPEYIPSSDAEENEPEIQMDQDVKCPLCSKLVKLRYVDPHIDSGCNMYSISSKSERPKSNSKSAWSNVFENRTKKSGDKRFDDLSERLPKQNYTVLKDKKIRDLLSEYRLSTNGSREQLIARHSQFVLIFNANLDRSELNRKSLKDLKKEMQKWEDSLSVKKAAVDDVGEYIKINKLDFKKHIEAIKSRSAGKHSSTNPGIGQNTSGDSTTSKPMKAVPQREETYDSERAPVKDHIIIADSQEESELL